MLPQTTPDSSAAGDARLPEMFEITRHFAASPEQIFDAWVGDGWAAWLPYPNTVLTVSDVDTRVGGHYRIQMQLPNGDVLSVTGVYREVSRPTKLVFSWLPSLGGRDSLVSVTLQPRNDGTLLTLRHEGLPTPELSASHRHGWLGSLDRLQARLPPQVTPGNQP